MPIPWLIGAAVMAVVAAVAANSAEDEEKERKEKERAERTRERLDAEANAQRERARAEQALREAREHRYALEQFAHNKAQALLEKHKIHNISLDDVVDSAIDNTARCEEIWQKAYVSSDAHRNTKNKIDAFKSELKEINDLSSILE